MPKNAYVNYYNSVVTKRLNYLYEQFTDERLQSKNVRFKDVYSQSTLLRNYSEQNTAYLNACHKKQRRENTIRSAPDKLAAIFDYAMNAKLDEAETEDEREAIKASFEEGNALLDELREATNKRLSYSEEMIAKGSSARDEQELLWKLSYFAKTNAVSLEEGTDELSGDEEIEGVIEETIANDPKYRRRDYWDPDWGEDPGPIVADSSKVVDEFLTRWSHGVRNLYSAEEIYGNPTWPEIQKPETYEKARRMVEDEINRSDYLQQLQEYRTGLVEAATRFSKNSPEYVRMLEKLQALEDSVSQSFELRSNSYANSTPENFDTQLNELKEAAANYYIAKLGSDKNDNRMKRFEIAEKLMNLGTPKQEHEKLASFYADVEANMVNEDTKVNDPEGASKALISAVSSFDLTTEAGMKDYAEAAATAKKVLYTLAASKAPLSAEMQKNVKILNGMVNVNILFEKEAAARQTLFGGNGAPNPAAEANAKSDLIVGMSMRNVMNKAPKDRAKILASMRNGEKVSLMRKEMLQQSNVAKTVKQIQKSHNTFTL